MKEDMNIYVRNLNSQYPQCVLKSALKQVLDEIEGSYKVG